MRIATFYFRFLFLFTSCIAVAETFHRPVGNPVVPRMHVKSFALSGALDFPGHGLYVREIQSLIEEKRQQYNDGFDVDALTVITDTVTQYYRSAGLILTTAFLPEQEIDNGIVTIAIVYGRLSGVMIEDNQLYDAQQLSNPFREFIDAPVDVYAIETGLLLMNDFPGYEATAVFVPGDAPGTSQLVIKTLEETSFSSQLWFDNYGTESTGEYRVRAGATLNNLFNLEDRLAVTLVQAFQPQNSLYGGVDYSFSYFEPSIRAGVSYIQSSYDVGGILADLGVSGESESLKLYGQGYLVRSKTSNLFVTTELAQKSASSDGLGIPTEDKLAVISAAVGFDSPDYWLGGRHAGNLRIHTGLEGQLGAMDGNGDLKSSRLLRNGGRAGGGFTKITANYSHSFPVNLAPITQNTYLLVRLELQQTSDALVSMERMSLGGPFSVRGYPIAEFLADSGQLFSLEYVARSRPLEEFPWLGNLQLSVYYDYGSGESNDVLANEEDSVTLSSIGIGAQVLPSDGLQVKVDLGIPLGSHEPSNDKSLQFFLTAGYRW